MPTPTIVTRASKGSALTYDELDTNFTNLRDAAGSGGTLTSDTTAITISTAGTTTITFTHQVAYVYVTATTGTITLNINNAHDHSLQPLVLVVNKVNSGANIGFVYNYSGDHGVSAGNRMLSYETGIVFFDIMHNPLLDNSSVTPQPPISIHRRASQAPYNWPFTPTATSFNGITSDDIISSTNAAGFATIDRSSTVTSYVNNATVDFANFSGMILINRQDGSSGNVALWLCGGGAAVKIGDSHGNESGTIAYNSGITGYRWTNNTGGTISATFAAIKTRDGA
jgi:hypothetical protein